MKIVFWKFSDNKGKYKDGLTLPELWLTNLKLKEKMERIADRGMSTFNILGIKKDSILLTKTLIGHSKTKKCSLIFTMSSATNGLSYQEKWMEGK